MIRFRFPRALVASSGGGGWIGALNHVERWSQQLGAILKIQVEQSVQSKFLSIVSENGTIGFPSPGRPSLLWTFYPFYKRTQNSILHFKKGDILWFSFFDGSDENSVFLRMVSFS